MTIDVVCALITNDQGRVLAARRSSSMDLPGKWEFPGGKLEPGESPEAAIVREIEEELNILVSVNDSLPPAVHHYEAKSIRLLPFICSVLSGEISLREHQSYDWYSPEELLQLDWAEADIPVLESYLRGKT